MIAPKEWHKFERDEDRIVFLSRCGLISSKARKTKLFCYNGGYNDCPALCNVVGFVDGSTAVVDFGGGLHCVNTELFRDMQVGMSAWILDCVKLVGVTRYAAIDVETTGLSKRDDKIIDIGISVFENGSEVDHYSQLINPCKTISSTITKLTGITNKMIADAPAIDSVICDVNAFVGNLPIVLHNAPFDLGFVLEAYSNFGLCMDNDIYDTLTISRKAYPSIKCHKLQSLAEMHNIDPGDAHRALSDARTTAKLFDILRKKQIGYMGA